MATLPFALELADETDVEPLPRLQLDELTVDRRTRRSRYAPAQSVRPGAVGAPGYRGSTADNWDFQRVRVNGRQEMTCTECGETTNDPYCVRCGRPTRDGGIIATRTRMVPTLSYLQDGEFVLI